MNKIIPLISFLFCFSLIGQAQTNVYTAQLNAVSKTKSSCATPVYYFVAVANFRAPGSDPTNTWFYPTTNVLSISCTNSDALVEYGTLFGFPHACGRGSLTWTDANWNVDTYRFSVYWSNNVPPPTNQFIPLTTVGFRTNSP